MLRLFPAANWSMMAEAGYFPAANWSMLAEAGWASPGVGSAEPRAQTSESGAEWLNPTLASPQGPDEPGMKPKA